MFLGGGVEGVFCVKVRVGMGADGVPGVLVRCKWVGAAAPLGTENTGRGTDTGGDEIVGAATVGAVPMENPPREKGCVVDPAGFINDAKGFVEGAAAVDAGLVVAKLKVGAVEGLEREKEGVVVADGAPKAPSVNGCADVAEVENMF